MTESDSKHTLLFEHLPSTLIEECCRYLDLKDHVCLSVTNQLMRQRSVRTIQANLCDFEIDFTDESSKLKRLDLEIIPCFEHGIDKQK